MRRVAVIVLLFAGRAAYASAPDPCALTATVQDARLTISISDGRESFLEGEIIPLRLAFTSSAGKRYWVENRNYDRSGRLGLETYCVEPTARDPLADYFRAGVFMGGGLGNEQQLNEKPFTAHAELNEWKQPGPGHYRVYAVSHRVYRPADPGEATPYDRIAVTLRSNTIEIDVTAADAEWRASELRDAGAAYRNSSGDQQSREAARRLRFLNTNESTELLAKLFWGLNDQPAGWDLMFGLFGSPHRTEAIAAMRREIDNPDHPVTQEFLHTLTTLEVAADPSWDPPTYDSSHPAISQEYWRRTQAHVRELMQTAVNAAAAALPDKTGRAHALTARALAESSDLLEAATALQVRKQLIAAWGELPEKTKQELIEYRWPLIAGPDMLPNLREYVSRAAPPSRSMESSARDAALKHIYDLDAAEGRLLILRDLRDVKAQPSISLAKLLTSDALRPIVQDAVGRIRKNDARELDYHLVELFADESALETVKEVFNERLGKWACEPQDAMLRYFLSVDLEFGAIAVERSLNAREFTGCYGMLLGDLGDSLPRVERLAVSALDDSDLEVARNAAGALARWGSESAEAALWSRLARFHKEWEGRESELRVTPEYNSPTARATALENALVDSIAMGTNWICASEKLDQLKALSSPREQTRVAAWIEAWERGGALILPSWYPEERPTFTVLQYSSLDEAQFRTKLSQMPDGTRLFFQMWKAGQIAPPISLEKQEEIFHALQKYAAQFGVTIEEKSDP